MYAAIQVRSESFGFFEGEKVVGSQEYLQFMFQRYKWSAFWGTRSATSKESSSTIPVLDGIRAIAALLVLEFHIDRMNNTSLWVPKEHPLAAALITSGESGVILFFVLSGFLLFMPYAKALLFEAKWPSARQFYMRRALRILPAYYLSLVLLILFSQPQYLQPQHWKDLFLFVTMFMDSTPDTFRQLNGPFWTLAVEWQFYMLMPLLMLGFYKLVGKIQGSAKQRFLGVLACCLLLITYGLCIRYVGIYCAGNPQETFHLPVRVRDGLLFFLYGIIGKYMETFALGMIISACYIYVQQSPFGEKMKARLRRMSPWLLCAGLVLLLFTAIWQFQVQKPVAQFSVLNPLGDLFLLLHEFLSGIGYSICILAILFGSRALTALFSFQPLRKLGTISFGIYIWHLPLLILFRDTTLRLFSPKTPLAVYLAFCVGVLVYVIPAAITSYVFVERPFMRLRVGSASKKEVAEPVEPVKQTVP